MLKKIAFGSALAIAFMTSFQAARQPSTAGGKAKSGTIQIRMPAKAAACWNCNCWDYHCCWECGMCS